MDEMRVRRLLREAWCSLEACSNPEAARKYHLAVFEHAESADDVRLAAAELCAEAILRGVRLSDGDQPDAFAPLFAAVRDSPRRIQTIAAEESRSTLAALR